MRRPRHRSRPLPALLESKSSRSAKRPLTVDRDPVLSTVDPIRIICPRRRHQPPSVNSGSGESRTELEKGDHGYTLRRDVEEVVLNVTVLDDHNKLVMNLTKPDFTVAEDGVPQTIISFQHEDIPVSMGILVDNSGSMRDKRAGGQLQRPLIWSRRRMRTMRLSS